jgi:hypothetical protein
LGGTYLVGHSASGGISGPDDAPADDNMTRRAACHGKTSRLAAERLTFLARGWAKEAGVAFDLA